MDLLFADLLNIASAEKREKIKKESQRRTTMKGNNFAISAAPVGNEQSSLSKVKDEVTLFNCVLTELYMGCEKNHTLEECHRMKEEPHKERTEFLKRHVYVLAILLKVTQVKTVSRE